MLDIFSVKPSMNPPAPQALPAHPPVPTVSAWVVRFSAAIKPAGVVLDLACGGGRHARYLAGLGLQVEAVDRDAAALVALADVAGVHTHCADLEGSAWPYPTQLFDAIIVTNYLHRPLFPLLASALVSGGVLIYETFRLGNGSYGRPSNPEFLLQAGELFEFASRRGLHVLAYEDGFCALPKPAMVQRLCAVKPPFLTPEIGRLE